ncbi:MAG: PAS domain S-box protein [Sphingobacteriaceae bacterium]|nr:PAS domain S-box protein [Sphingobacteriaceae bacterium]
MKALTEQPNIIAIGASAGGLEALQSFLLHLPELPNVSIIIAQHLSPTHKSLLVQLLSRQTNLKVAGAVHNERLAPNTVYIAPPNKDIFLSNFNIQLGKPSATIGPKPSVDVLFESLSKVKGSRIIAIVLSGTGSDGSKGLQLLRGPRYLKLVQDPATAKFDGMPVAASQSGQIDQLLTPDKMGSAILAFLQNGNKQGLLPEHGIHERGDDFKEIVERLGHYAGTDFANYKTATLERRIEKRMHALKFSDYPSYLQFIAHQPEELEQLFNEVLIGVTQFFRDKEAFEALKTPLLQLLSHKKEHEPLRIWVAGCSTGEEAYSLAILVDQLTKQLKRRVALQIFATDIDERAIAVARKGVYSAQSLKQLSSELVQHYFVQQGSAYELTKAIRSKVLFSKHDLLRNPPFLRLDLITCRNLLIYFNNRLQEQVMPIFHYGLNNEGILFLGKSESIGPFGDLFAVIDGKNKLFKRKNGAGVRPLKLANFRPLLPRAHQVALPVQEKTHSLLDRIKDTLFKTYEHPYVVVNMEYNVLEVFGDVRLFMTLSSGNIQVNVLKMVNPELQIELRGLLAKVFKQHETQRSQIKKFELFGQEYYVRMIAKPLIHHGGKDDLFMLIFEKLDISDFVQHSSPSTGVVPLNEQYLDLEMELASTKEHLQTYIEEIETSNEELQSLNEEMQSTNEELQSSNEELETTNEELQSTNEEIQIAYAELRAAHEDLALKDQLLQGMQANTRALLNNNLQAFVLVDNAYQILDLNEKAKELLLHISGKQAAENISMIDFLPAGEVETFVRDCKEVLNTSQSIMASERQLRALNGQYLWLQLSFTPVLVPGRKPTQLSIGMFDISELKLAQQRLERNQSRLESLLNSQTHYVLRTDLEGKHTYWNQIFEDDYGWLYKDSGLLGADGLVSICDHDHAKTQDAVIACLQNMGKPIKVELDKPGKGGTIRTTVWEFLCIPDDHGDPLEIQCTGIEVTQLRQLRESEKLLNEAQLLAQLGNWNFDLQNNSLTWSDGLYEVFGVDRKAFDETHDSFLDFIQEGDRVRVKAVSEQAQRTGESFHVQYKITTPAGEVRTIEEYGYAEKDDSGRIIRLYGTAQNITERIMSEEKILNSDRIFENAADLLCIADYDGYFVTINPAWTKTLGWSREELLSRPFLSLVHPADQGVTESEYETVSSGDGSFAFENRYQCKDGSYRWLSWKSRAYPAERKIYASARDITAEKVAKASLQASEARFQKIIEFASDIVVLLNEQGDQTMVSPVAEKLTGFKPEEFVGKNFTEVIHPEDIEQVQQAYNRVLNEPERSHKAQYRLIHKTKGWVWMEGSAQNFLHNPEFEAVLLTVRDISESKAKELELKKMLVAFEQSPSTIVITDLAGNIEFVNPKFESITGYAPEEVIGKNPRILQSGVQSPVFYEQMWKTLVQGKSWRGELCNKKKNGELYWESASISPIFNEAGKIVNYLAVKEDITEQKLARELITKSEEKYRSIIEVSNTGAWEFNVSTKELWVSDEYLLMLGFTKQELYALRLQGYELWQNLMHPDDRAQALKRFEQYWTKADGRSYENYFRLIGKNQRIVWVWSRGKRLRNADGSLSDVILGTHIDISSLKAAELKVREKELYYHTLLKAQPDAMFVMDRAFKFLDYKAKEGDLYTKPEHFLNQQIEAVMPDENAQFTKKLVQEAFKTKKLVEAEYALEIQGHIRHFNARVVALDEEKAMITVRDITEATDYLNRIKKLLSLEEEQKKRLLNFTHIVSHNLRSHTANMQGILMLMELEAPELLELEYINIIRNSANNLNETLEHLNEVLDISKNLESKFEPINLKNSINLAVNSVAQLAKDNQVEVLEIPEDANITLSTIPAYLDSILLNLLTNAIKFKDPQKPQSTIKISVTHSLKCVLLTVSDNGLGIDLHRHGELVFGMYKTFHNLGDSKGLGLFISKNQVEAMGGSIKVKSKPGRGSTFKVFLPR